MLPERWVSVRWGTISELPQTSIPIKTSTSLNASNWPPADSLKIGQDVGAKWSGLTWNIFLPEPGGDSLPQLQRKLGLCSGSCHSCLLRVELYFYLPGQQMSSSVTVKNDKVDSPEGHEWGLCPGQRVQFLSFYLRLSPCCLGFCSLQVQKQSCPGGCLAISIPICWLHVCWCKTQGCACGNLGLKSRSGSRLETLDWLRGKRSLFFRWRIFPG